VIIIDLKFRPKSVKEAEEYYKTLHVASDQKYIVIAISKLIDKYIPIPFDGSHSRMLLPPPPTPAITEIVPVKKPRTINKKIIPTDSSINNQISFVSKSFLKYCF